MSSNNNNIFSQMQNRTSWRIFKKNKFVMNSMTAIAALVAFAVSFSANAELPTNGNAVAGTVAIGVHGGNMHIDQQTQNAVINWDTFSIGVDNVVNFANGTGATLNRVVTNAPSALMGTLNATGGVYLINQNGIVVGETGVINAGGNFVASSLEVPTEEFMRGGDLNFTGDSNAQVVNLGRISAGNDAILLGRQVLNKGYLKSENGTAGAAAGDDILLTSSDAATQRIYVKVGEGQVANTGVISGVNAELRAASNNPYALAIQNSGEVRASGLVEKGGRLVLSSGDSGTIENSGTLDASSATGVGGDIRVEARNIRMMPASMVDASGAYGGGNIKIGGGYMGQDSSINNAENTTIAEGANLKSDATIAGDGGEIIVWSDDTTTFSGNISGVGAGENSKGAFVEVSGKDTLVFNSWNVDLRGGENGSGGTLLLDPRDINIVDSAGVGFLDTTANTIADADMENFLNTGASLALTTSGTGGSGDITVDNDVSVTWDKNSTLLLRADRDFNVAGTFDASAATGAANIRFDAARNMNVADNTVLNAGQRGAVQLNAATENQGTDFFGNWQNGNGTLNFGNNVQIGGNNIQLKSGIGADGSRSDLGTNVELSPGNGSTYAGIQALGFDNVDLNSQGNSDIETTGGSLIITANNINIDESLRTKGDLYLSAASFSTEDSSFIPVALADATDTRDEFRSDGWKGQGRGVVNFANNANLVMDVCCGVTITSGISDDNTRTSLTAPDVTFAYNNDYNTYQWFEVKGFENFNSTVEGNSLNSNSFVDIRNTNNVINYDIVAARDIPANVDLPNGELADEFGYVNVMGGVHDDTTLEYSDNIFNTGTTTFDNTLVDGEPLVVSAATDVTITSGLDSNGDRTSITDASDTTPDGVSYAGRSDNVVFEHTDNNGQFDGNVRVEGFEEIALDTSRINGELRATGNITTYSSELTNINDNLTASNILSISEQDINVRNNSTLTTTGDTILVVDEATPLSPGTGDLIMGEDTTINANRIALFTATQGQNDIQATLNGEQFVPGVEYQNSEQEVWSSFFQQFLNEGRRQPRNPFVVYYKDNDTPVFNRPDCSTNPDAAGCESFVEGPDVGKEYRINLTQNQNNTGEENNLREGNSADVRNTEFVSTNDKAYVDNRLYEAEKLKTFATAFPLQVVGATLEGLTIVPGFSGIAMALNGVTTGITNVVTGGAR